MEMIMSFLTRSILLARRAFWWLTRPTTLGVRAIVKNDKNEVLLVKHTYDNCLYLPGGEVGNGENVKNAIKRELFEEVNINCTEMHVVGIYNNKYEYKNDHVILFYVDDFKSEGEKKRSFEIESAAFYPMEHLPDNLSPATKRSIFLKPGKQDFGTW